MLGQGRRFGCLQGTFGLACTSSVWLRTRVSQAVCCPTCSATPGACLVRAQLLTGVMALGCMRGVSVSACIRDVALVLAATYV